MNDLIDSIDFDEEKKKRTLKFRHFNRQAARHHMVNEPAYTHSVHYRVYYTVLCIYIDSHLARDKSKMTKLIRNDEKTKNTKSKQT